MPSRLELGSSITLDPIRGPFDYTAPIPGSKSHTNRALLCAGLAADQSTLSGVLDAEDTRAMVTALRELGAVVELAKTAPTLSVTGIGAPKPEAAATTPLRIDARQSGTSARFLLPVLCGLQGRFVLDGDQQLRARPFGPQLGALADLGAHVTGDRLPLEIAGRQLEGGEVTVDGAISSQFLSGLLLAGPLMSGPLTISVEGELVSKPYVELTVTTMRAFGARVDIGEDFRSFRCYPGPYRAADIIVEPDATAASYFWAAAAIGGGTVRVDGIDDTTVQGDVAFVDALEAMGARVERGAGWLEVTGTGKLQGIDIDMRDISDTAQTLAVVATFASSPTTIRGIGFIRNKETDRIAAMTTELNRRSISATEFDDGMVIHPGTPTPGPVHTYDDHRMAMSMSLLGLVYPGIEILDPSCVAKTFPNFFEVLAELG